MQAAYNPILGFRFVVLTKPEFVAHKILQTIQPKTFKKIAAVINVHLRFTQYYIG